MVAKLSSRDFCCKHLEIVDLVNASGTILASNSFFLVSQTPLITKPINYLIYRVLPSWIILPDLRLFFLILRNEVNDFREKLKLSCRSFVV